MNGTNRYIVTCVNNIALIPKKESCDPSNPFESSSRSNYKSHNIRKKNDRHLCSHNSVTSVTAATTTSGEHRGDFPLKKKNLRWSDIPPLSRVSNIQRDNAYLWKRERERRGGEGEKKKIKTRQLLGNERVPESDRTDRRTWPAVQIKAIHLALSRLTIKRNERRWTVIG